jgi:hypothetical protein
LLEDALGLVDRRVVAFDLNRVAASDDAHPECVANLTQVLIAATEKEQRFVAIVESNGCIRWHGVIRGL